MVCGSPSLPEKDEEIIYQTINRAVVEKGKVLIAWLKNRRLTVDADVLAQFLNPALAMSFAMTPSAQGYSNVLLHSFDQRRRLEQPPDRKPGYAWGIENLQQQRVSLPATTRTCNTKQGSVTGKLVLKSKLRYGKISFESADLKFLSGEFCGIPEDIVQHLLQGYQHIHERQVKIMLVPSHNQHLCYVGDEEIEMADNDLLLLQTRVKNGVVSFHNDEIEARYPADWQVPVYILEELKTNASNGKLFIISDEKGNLKCTVKRTESKFIDALFGVRDMVLAVAFSTLKK